MVHDDGRRKNGGSVEVVTQHRIAIIKHNPTPAHLIAVKRYLLIATAQHRTIRCRKKEAILILFETIIRPLHDDDDDDDVTFLSIQYRYRSLPVFAAHIMPHRHRLFSIIKNTQCQ